MSETDSNPPQQKKESLFANLGFNVIIPTVILTQLSKEEYLGPTLALIVTLAFPIVYGVRDFYVNRKANFFSILGFVSILLTGGIALLKLPPEYIAIKEAAIPFLLGAAVLISLKTPFPLVKTLIYNPQIFDTDKVKHAVEQRNSNAKFEKLLFNASALVASAFFLSSVLNYLLAIYIVTAVPGSVEYTQQLGKMQAWGYVVISLPSMTVMIGAMFFLFSGIKKLTGLTLEDIVRAED